MEQTWQILLNREELLELKNAIQFAQKNEVIFEHVAQDVLAQINRQLAAS